MLKTKSQLFSLPVIGGYIKRFTGNIRDFGFQEGIRKEINRSGTKIEIYGKDKNLDNILSKSPILIVANHPFEIETLAVNACLPNRKKFQIFMRMTPKN